MSKKTETTIRPPVVTILGHIDHGKSTLLDYIRKSKIERNEEGGITQHLASYEIPHTTKDGQTQNITFLDTPGHEAFTSIRNRGVLVADVAILVVSAEDGIKPQTLEAYKEIKESNTPFIVAISKIDKPNANPERTKQGLSENEIYIEEYSGSVPCIEISSITGQGIDDLLEMITLTADMEELTGDKNLPAEGVIVESNRDPQRGIQSTAIIKNGTLKKGMSVVSGTAICPVRMLHDFQGNGLDEVSFSSPVGLAGWNEQPEAGSNFISFATKKDAEKYLKSKTLETKSEPKEITKTPKIPIILKADTVGSLDAVKQELKKLEHKDLVGFLSAETGSVSENDIRRANITENTVIIGFNTPIDSPAKKLNEKFSIPLKNFSIIYELKEWVEKYIDERRPREKIEETTGQLKVLKVFSYKGKKNIIGGIVESGIVSTNKTVNILRVGKKIGSGKIKELQQQKSKTESVSEGLECGAMVESSIEIAPRDLVEVFETVER